MLYVVFGPVSPRSFPQPGHVYDVAVVGAGLAGSEVAWRLAHGGFDVLLVSQSLDSVGNVFQPNVNFEFPAGSLFEEARVAALPDRSTWGLHREVKGRLEATAGVHLLQSCVRALEPGEGAHVLRTWEGPSLQARLVVLAVGSFLRGRLRIGSVEEEAGRLSEVAYDFLHDDLLGRGVTLAQREDEFEGEAGGLPYTVRYAVLGEGELAGFHVKRWPGVFAVGRCAPGDVTYDTVLVDAARLAEELMGVLGE